MKIEYRVTKRDPKEPFKYLDALGKDGWILSCRDGDSHVWYKIVRKTNLKTEPVYNDEWQEFKAKYKTINNKGLSVHALVVKHNELVKKGLHKKIMDNLEEYYTYIEVGNKQNYTLMASTYLNGRYNDSWNVVKDMSKKWIDIEFKNRKTKPEIIDHVLTMINAWETDNPTKELNNGKLDNMIYYAENGKHRD